MPIDMLVLHYTGMTSPEAAVARLCDPAAKVSSHYLIDDDGRVTQLVAERRRAHHAGISHWRGHDDLNGRSIGIEITNPGHEWGYRAFPAPQMAAVVWLCREILGRHPIPPRNVVGHSDIAPDRKQDPGELFDWPALAARGVGLWPAEAAVPVRDAREALTAIGYPVPELGTALLAFQRRWLPGTMTGEACDATRGRLAAVLRAVTAGS